MRDLQNEADVMLLVNTFYDKVKKDETLGPVFDHIIGSNWDHHLPTMYKFWNMVLLSKAGYEGYPTKKHMEVNRKIPLHQVHFDRWLELWNETANTLFKGETAKQATEKAKLMGELIRIKVEDSNKGHAIQ